MARSFRQVEDALITKSSVQSILQIFESTYGDEVDYELQEYQVTLMNKAIEYDRKDLLQCLINKEWPFKGSAPVYSIGSPLLTACAEDKYEFVSLLLEHGAHVNSDVRKSGEPREYSPMHPIMEQDNLELMKLILPHYEIQQNMTPLHSACSLGAEKCAAFLLEGKYFIPDHISDTKRVPLDIAVQHSIPITKLLIQHGASVKNFYRGEGLIQHSMHPKWSDRSLRRDPRFLPDLIKMLIDAGADVNVVSHESALIERFFEHIQILQKVIMINGEEVLHRCDEYWSELLETAQMISNAGLIVNEGNLRRTYMFTFRLVWQLSTAEMSAPPDFTEVAAVRPLKWSHELLKFFHDRNTLDIDDDIFHYTHCSIQQMLFYLVYKSLLGKCHTVCGLVYDIFRQHFLNDDQQFISVNRMDSIFLTFQTVKSSEEPILRLLKMLILFVPVEKLHELQSSVPYVVPYRISLLCLAKMAVISSIQVPREKNINSLELPIVIKDILLLQD